VLKALTIFSGNANRELASAICRYVETPLGRAEVTRFADGEVYVEINENVRGVNCFVVQPTCSPPNQALMELLIMIDALKRASAGSIVAIVPYFGYARQDRKAKPREPISARFVADMIQLAGADRVLTMDLHAGQIQGFFTIPVDHMTALPLFANHFRDLGVVGPEVVSVAPDAGRAKMAQRFAEMIEGDLAIMHKTRPAHDLAAVTEIAGRVRDKVAIVGDDVIMTGGTLLANVKVLKEQGAKEVWVFATHGLFCGDALMKFRNSNIAGIVVTDTVPIDLLHKPDNLQVLSVGELLADTIMNVFADDSVSAIFGGENQLF